MGGKATYIAFPQIYAMKRDTHVRLPQTDLYIRYVIPGGHLPESDCDSNRDTRCAIGPPPNGASLAGQLPQSISGAVHIRSERRFAAIATAPQDIPVQIG